MDLKERRVIGAEAILLDLLNLLEQDLIEWDVRPYLLRDIRREQKPSGGPGRAGGGPTFLYFRFLTLFWAPSCEGRKPSI